MNISSRVLRAALDDVFDAVQAADPAGGNGALRVALRAAETKARAIVASGTIMSDEANGHRAQFASYGAGQLTPMEILEGWAYLVDLYDQSAAEAASQDPTIVYQQMVLNLRPIMGVTSNFMYLSK